MKMHNSRGKSLEEEKILSQNLSYEELVLMMKNLKVS